MRIRLAAVVLTATFCTIYLPDLGRGFVKDDYAWISKSRVHAPADVARLFAGNVGFYRPLVSTTFAVDYAVWGLDARGYAATNLVLLLADVLLLFLLARRHDAQLDDGELRNLEPLHLVRRGVDHEEPRVHAAVRRINTTSYQVQWFQIPKLAIVELSVVTAGQQGDVSFGVVVPYEKPTAFGVLAGLTADAGVVIDLPPLSTDGNPVLRMDAGNIARFTFHYTDTRPAGSAPPIFTARATANAGLTEAPPKRVQPAQPCNGCSSRHQILTDPINATWFQTDVTIRLDGLAPGSTTVTRPSEPLRLQRSASLTRC